jgi:hypothetical protein
MGERSTGGERTSRTGSSSRPATSARVCQEKGCTTRLSIYNDGQHCSLHAPMVTPRTRGKKIA